MGRIPGSAPSSPVPYALIYLNTLKAFYSCSKTLYISMVLLQDYGWLLLSFCWGMILREFGLLHCLGMHSPQKNDGEQRPIEMHITSWQLLISIVSWGWWALLKSNMTFCLGFGPSDCRSLRKWKIAPHSKCMKDLVIRESFLPCWVYC